MKLQMFAIYDSAAHAYMQPIFSHNEELAVRSWSDAVNQPDTMFFKFPDDYTLHHLGEWDDGTGEFHPLAVPKRIVSALELKAQPVQSMELFNEVSNDAQLSGHPQSDNTPQ